MADHPCWHHMCKYPAIYTFHGVATCYCIFSACAFHSALKCEFICVHQNVCTHMLRIEMAEKQRVVRATSKKVTMPVLDTPSFPQVLNPKAPLWTPKGPIVPDGVSHLKPA